MIAESVKSKILGIWDKYIHSGKVVLNTKGEPIADIDEARLKAIFNIKIIIGSFLDGYISIGEFKTSLDGYNKRNNLWGFTAAKGQMFFNLLVNTSNSPKKLTELLKESITQPNDISEAKAKLDKFERFVRVIYERGTDKRRVPKPGSTGYFLSYFWQVYNPERWPILYSSLVNSFDQLGIWQEHESQKDEYEYFYNLNEEVKAILKSGTGLNITNWDAEHAFWNDSANPMISPKPAGEPAVVGQDQPVQLNANFNVSDYIIPRLAKLVELSQSKDKTKSSEFEKMVSEAFKLLEFDVQVLGQGTGRNPDAIITFTEDRTAFLVDAKAYGDGYALGVDDRAIREYINHYSPKLVKDGFKKLGFIIVSNSFRSNPEEFIHEITWTTDVKRFILLTSEALLYMLAYRAKDNLSTKSVIDFIVSSGPIITVDKVIAKFDDV